MGSTGGPSKIRRSSNNQRYKTFHSDIVHEPFGPEHYEDDGGATADWFMRHTNAEELYDIVDSFNADYVDGYDAFDYWARGYFMRGQQYRGFDRLDEDEQAMTRIFDTVLDQGTNDTGFEVVRRASWVMLGDGISKYESQPDTIRAFLNDMKGQTIINRGNMSTAAADSGLLISVDARERPVEFHIKVPANSKGAGMWIGDYRVNPGWEDGQREFMFNRDSLFKIGTYHYSKKKDCWIVNLTWRGHTEHDYGSNTLYS